MRVGERVRISSNRDSVKVALYRLKKEGMSFKTSVAGMATGIIVERIG